MRRITFPGLGAIGSRLAPHLIEAGHEVMVWNRSPAAVTAAEERGARSAATPREAAEGAPGGTILSGDNQTIFTTME